MTPKDRIISGPPEFVYFFFKPNSQGFKTRVLDENCRLFEMITWDAFGDYGSLLSQSPHDYRRYFEMFIDVIIDWLVIIIETGFCDPTFLFYFL